MKETQETKVTYFNTVEDITNGLNQLILNAQKVGNTRMVSGLVKLQTKLLKKLALKK